MLQTITRMLISLVRHPVYGPVAKHLVRIATVELVRAVRHATRSHTTTHTIS